MKCIYLHISHISHILYVSIWDVDWLRYNRAAFGDSEDDERSYRDLPRVASISFTCIFSSWKSATTPAVPSHADLNMRKVMLGSGGPNYKTVLLDTDIHMGPDSENIPGERCGEARRANLKQKARFISWSVAETFVYCTLNTVLIEDTGDVLQTFVTVRISFVFLLLLVVSCTLHAVSHTACYDILYIFDNLMHINAYIAYIVLVHMNVFRTIFAQRTSSTAPYLLCQRMYCVWFCLMSNWTRYLGMKVTKVPVTLSLWLGLSGPETYHDVLQKWQMINDSCCTGLIPLMQWSSGPSCCKTWSGWIVYSLYERQEMEQRQRNEQRRAFGRANSGLIFQEAQLEDMHSDPFIHLFYGNKSFSRHHKGYPMYPRDWGSGTHTDWETV